MPSLLNLVPNAVSQGQAQIVHAEVATPAPASFTDPLYVVIPDWSTEFSFTITDWPAVHGLTLPLPGDAVLLITDNRGLLRCVWWDGQMAFSTQTSRAHYLTPTASDIGSYYQQILAPYSPKTPVAISGLQNLQVLRNYVTRPGVPNLTFLPAGQFEFHIHAVQTAGNQTVQLFAEFWECNAVGADIAMIGQTQTSLPLTFNEIEYRLFFTTLSVYVLAATSSRIVCRLKTLVGGTGGAAIQLFVGGVSDSHTIIPAASSTAAAAPTYTTATKPAAASVPAGTVIFVSDGGGGAVFQGSTGAAWVNLG